MVCIVCEKKLTGRQKKFCSNECKQKDLLKTQARYRREKRAKTYVRKKEIVKTLCGGCKWFFQCRNLDDWLEVPHCVTEYEIIDYATHDGMFTKSLIVKEII